MNTNTLLWGALTAGAIIFGGKQRGLVRTGLYLGAAYTGLRTVNALTGSNLLGLSGATVAIESMF